MERVLIFFEETKDDSSSTPSSTNTASSSDVSTSDSNAPLIGRIPPLLHPPPVVDDYSTDVSSHFETTPETTPDTTSDRQVCVWLWQHQYFTFLFRSTQRLLQQSARICSITANQACVFLYIMRLTFDPLSRPLLKQLQLGFKGNLTSDPGGPYT